MENKKTKIIKGCDEWYKNIHPYQISTSRARHPIHIIEGGEVITEDMGEDFSQAGDVGVWGLNQKDYEWFKAHIKDIEVGVE